MSPLAAEQTELLRALARHGVEFVVVGGVAAQVHGWRGATADLDIAVSTEDSNVEGSTSRWRA
jgi:superfamily I DNA/RNA helicase